MNYLIALGAWAALTAVCYLPVLDECKRCDRRRVSDLSPRVEAALISSGMGLVAALLWWGYMTVAEVSRGGGL